MPSRARKPAPKVRPNHAEIPKVAAQRFAAARKAIEEWTTVLKEARAEIEDAMADNENGDLDGVTVLVWKHGKRRSFNQAAFKKDHPNLVEEYTDTTETRTLTVQAQLATLLDDE